MAWFQQKWGQSSHRGVLWSQNIRLGVLVPIPALHAASYIYTCAHMHALTHVAALILYKAVLWAGTLLAREKSPYISKEATFLKSSRTRISAS